MPDSEQTCARCGQPVGTSLGGRVCAACFLEEALGESEAAIGITGAAGLPRRFGRYELLDEVGRGGMGVVYRAREPGLQRSVALKMLIAGEFADELARKRLLREARAVARLAHPNIVSIYEVGEHEGHPYFAMEYVAGNSLGGLLHAGSLDMPSIVGILLKLARAVHYAHTQGVIHRDLKPANVLIDDRGEPKLTDFGLTKMSLDLTLTIQSAGSPNFMAPEQASSNLGVTGIHTDVFGLGAILYYLLTARAPFAKESLAETLLAVIQEDPVAPRRIRAETPLDLETICLKCLRKPPQERYKSALEVAEELERFRDSHPIQGRRIGMMGHLTRWCRREPALGTALAGCLLLGAMLALTMARRNPVQTKSNEAAPYPSPILTELVSARCTVARHPTAVVIEDFNKDGLLDLAYVSREENILETLLGTPEGQFRVGQRFEVGLAPESLTKADVNGDGIMDLVCANNGADSITILMGRADGKFVEGAGSPVPVGNAPKEVVAADLNKDGHVDLIVANFSGSSISILMGNGQGAFHREPKDDLEAGVNPWGLAVGDLNGDGWPDFVSTDVGDGTLRVWYSKAGQGFGLKKSSILKAGRRPFHVALTDLNRDGRLDILSTATDDRLVHVFLQSQNGDFSEGNLEPLFVGDNHPRRIATADLNRDGLNDFIVANESGSFTVFMGKGDGTFQMDTQRPYHCGMHVISIAIADLDRDKQPDLVVLCGHPTDADGSILVYRNQMKR